MIIIKREESDCQVCKLPTRSQSASKRELAIQMNKDHNTWNIYAYTAKVVKWYTDLRVHYVKRKLALVNLSLDRYSKVLGNLALVCQVGDSKLCVKWRKPERYHTKLLESQIAIRKMPSLKVPTS